MQNKDESKTVELEAEKPVLTMSELVKLSANVIKAKLTRHSIAEKLQREFDYEMERACKQNEVAVVNVKVGDLPLKHKLKRTVDSENDDDLIWKEKLASKFPHVKMRPNPTDPNPRNHSYKNMYEFYYLTRSNWLTANYKKLSFAGHGNCIVTALLFDDEKIVSGSDDQSIHIYNIKNGELTKKLTGHEGGVWAVQYYGSSLVSGSTDRTVRVWNMDTGKCTHKFEGHTSTVRCIIIVPPASSLTQPISSKIEPSERPVIVSGCRDSTIRVWALPELDTTWFPENTDTPNPYLRHTLIGHTACVRDIAAHENILVSGSYDTSVRVWDLVTGECIHILNGHKRHVYCVVYSYELKRAASGSMDTTVKVWDTISGENLFTLTGHTSLVGLLELSSNYLISACADSTLRIWCPKSGKCLAVLPGHKAAITSFHHDPVNNRLVSGSEDGVKVWELSSTGYDPSGKITPSTSHLSLSLEDTQTSEGQEAVYGRFIGDLVKDVTCVWKTRMHTTRLVCAVQDTEKKTWFQVLDFSEGEGLGTSTETAGDGNYRDLDSTMEVDDLNDK